MRSSPQRPASPLRFAVPAAIAVAALLWLRDPSAGSAALSGHARHTDCGVPIHAYVNDVDPRFGFDRYEVERALQQAMALWQAHADRPLFSPEARRRPMPVDLVFDARQQQAGARADSHRSLDREHRRLEDRQAALQRLQQQIDSDRDAYARAEEDFNRRAAAHDRRVTEWNANPSARTTAGESRLRAEADALAVERDALRQRHRRVNEQVADANRQADALRRDADRFSREAERHNRAAATPITAGGYSFNTRDGRRITVYTAGSSDELVLVLAHELGHALGIGHVAEPDAVMHDVVGAVPLPLRTLSPADVAALQVVCDA